jgi:hypothetical protein
VYIQHFVTFRIFIEVVHLALAGRADGYGAIAVHEQHFARIQVVVAGGCYFGGVEVGVPQGVVVDRLCTILYGLVHGLHARGRVDVIEV